MALSPSTAAAGPLPRDHRFHELRIARVVRETADASTFVLDVPPDLRAAFAYEAGQFCTFRVQPGDEPLVRSYSMSSAPGVDRELQVTVKRVPGGAVSNWMNDRLEGGDTIAVAPPTGRFRLTDTGAPLVAFAAGSGITPVFSLVKTALATTDRRVLLLYANRDRESTIFADDLATLADRHGGRLELVHRYDVEHGYLTPEAVRAHLDRADDGECYVCGPPAFMDVVEATLLAAGVARGRLHIERFEGVDPLTADVPVSGDDEPAGPPREVTVELDGQTRVAPYRAGTTLLQTARQAGLAPPFSCEAGNCATCMARLVEGAATMHANNALTDDEVAGGWVLTCQAVPTTPTVRVVYGDEP
jgi:ferredoxin-NADP reductase